MQEIIDLPWIIKDGFKVTINNDETKSDFKTLAFDTTFNKAKFNSIYSNLDTISFYKIITDIKKLKKKG